MKLEELGDNNDSEIKRPIMFNQDSSVLQINHKSMADSCEIEVQNAESSGFIPYFDNEHKRELSPATSTPIESEQSPKNNKSQIQQTSVQKMLDKYQSKYV